MGCWPGCLADFLPTGISLNCRLPGAALHAVVIMPIKTVWTPWRDAVRSCKTSCPKVVCHL